LIYGFQVSQAIYVAAALRLTDHLALGAKTAGELAALSDAHAGALHRLLTALASVGVLREREQGRFALTATGAFLRSDPAGTHAPFAELMGQPHLWRAWGGLLHAVRTGATAFDHVFGCRVWEYRASHQCRRRDRNLPAEMDPPQLGRRGVRPHPRFVPPRDEAGQPAARG
jgi:hypothetical protein